MKLVLGKDISLRDFQDTANKLTEVFADYEFLLTVDAGDIVLVFKKIERADVKEDSKAEDTDTKGWVEITDSAAYKVENGVVRIGYLKDGKYQTLATFNMSDLVDLFEELPEKFTKDDVFKVAKEMNLSVPYSTINYLMHFFSRHPYFDAELEKEGRQLVLVKNSYSLGKENRAKMEIERETIGTPWKV